VSDTSISTLAREKAEMVAETAQEALGAIAQKVNPAPPPKKHRKWPWLLLLVLALGALAYWWNNRSTDELDLDYAAPDAFGDAVVEEQQAASDNGRTRVATS
jgi:hypothetical protein